MIDLSGSCWDKEIFTEFVSHIDKVISISGAETKIFTFDTEVQNEIILPLRTKLSTLLTSESVQITGGGGTDFIPVIQAVEQYNPDVAVGFTDCYGPFTPQQPTGIPFIWATPKLAAKAPWGKQLTLSSD
jgi:predicted metal-dependent peptidase